MTKRKGVAQREASLTFAIVQRFETEFAPAAAGGKAMYPGTADIIGGTGRYAGITGKSTITGTALTPLEPAKREATPTST